VRKPDFVIIGAAKAATTWIAHQLRQRDDVFLPGPEPHYFSREYHRGGEWYGRWFDGASPGQLVGEKSADYLADEAVPERLARDLPEARLIVQLRDPVQRAYSDYCMFYRRGAVGSDVAWALDPLRTSHPRFLNDGLYGRHLARLFDHVPRSRVTIILHDDIVAAPEQSLATVTTALRLPKRLPVALDERINDRATPLAPFALRRLPPSLKAAFGPLRGMAPFATARRLIARPVLYPPLDADLRLRLEDFYREDTATLAALTGLNLDRWYDPVRAAA
jgi:hypothetical protein